MAASSAALHFSCSATKKAGRKHKEGIVGEFIKQSTGLKNNIKRTDGNKPSRERES